MKRLLTSCFGLGLLPIAPGTWGSLPAAVVFGVLCYLGVGLIGTSVLMVVIGFLASAVCVAFAPEVIEAVGEEDPRVIVADETAGQAVVFIGAYAASAKEIWVVMVIGFLVFRVFDIVKPWPCRRLEKLPAGWGILAVDLMAGVYAAVVVQICHSIFFSAAT